MSRHAIATTAGGAGRIPGAAVRSLGYAEIIAIVALTVILLILFARAIGGTYNGNVATEPASPSEASGLRSRSCCFGGVGGFAGREGGTQRAQRTAGSSPLTSTALQTRRNGEPQMNADVRGYERGQGGQMTC